MPIKITQDGPVLIVLDYRTGEVFVYPYSEESMMSGDELCRYHHGTTDDVHYMCTDDLIINTN